MSRPDLLALAAPNQQRKVVLISAPAGYGKSILAAQWCAADATRPAAWVSATEADDDPVVLLAHLLAAVQSLRPVRSASRIAATSPPAPAGAAGIELRRAMELQAPFLLVVDDVHRVSNRASLAVLGDAVDALPPGCQVVLATREDPPIGLPRRRANGELLEVRADRLAMDQATTARYLAAAGVDAGPAAIDTIHRSTEGWPAGIGLAALAHDPSRPDVIPHTISGAHREIADYLFEEVLARQAAPIQRFLLHTSVVPRFSAPLGDELLGWNGSAGIIRELERTNLFVIPLDPDRGWFRYHHLFQQLLGAELDRADPAARRRLLSQGAAWHERNGTIGEAIECAQAAGDVGRLGQLVLANWEALASRGQTETLRRWVSRSSDEEICSDASLAIGAGWVAALLGDVERAERYTAAAAQHELAVPAVDGASSLQASLAILRSALGSGGVAQMLRDGRLVLATESPTRTRWYLGGHRAVGTANLLLGRVDDAIVALDEAVLLAANRPELDGTRVFNQGYLALALLERGDLARAAELVGATDQLALVTPVDNTLVPVPNLVARAAVLARSGDRPGAVVAVTVASGELAVTQAAPWMLADLCLRCAETAQMVGEADLVTSLLDRARRALARLPDGGVLPERLERLERRAQLVEPRLATLTPAERRVLKQLASHRTLAEIGDELFISRATVKTHVGAIYSKLGVSSRAAAVALLGERSTSPRSRPT